MYNDAHLHLIVNHLPLVATLLGLLVLLGGFISKNFAVKQTALAVFIFAAVTAIISNFSGEGAEEVVEHLGTISHSIIHEHEEVAESFLLLSILLGILSIATSYLLCKGRKIAKVLLIVVLALAAFNMFVAQKVGTSGGAIMHQEIVE